MVGRIVLVTGGGNGLGKAVAVRFLADGRSGYPGDVAETVHFLASEGARHITGQTLHVNGGAHTTR